MILFTSFKIRAAVLGAALSASSSLLAEDLTLVYKVTVKGAAGVTTHLYSANRARFNQGDDDTVVNLEAGTVIHVSHRKKEYSEATFAEIEQAVAHVSAEMEKSNAPIPEALRKKMSGVTTKEVAVTKGEGKAVASLPCDTYLISMNPTTTIETCVTKAIETPFDRKYFKELSLFTSPLMVGNPALRRMLEKLRDIEGLPLAFHVSITLMGKPVEAMSEVIDISRAPLAKDAFDVPADYKRVDSPFAKMPR